MILQMIWEYFMNNKLKFITFIGRFSWVQAKFWTRPGGATRFRSRPDPRWGPPTWIYLLIYHAGPEEICRSSLDPYYILYVCVYIGDEILRRWYEHTSAWIIFLEEIYIYILNIFHIWISSKLKMIIFNEFDEFAKFREFLQNSKFKSVNLWLNLGLNLKFYSNS